MTSVVRSWFQGHSNYTKSSCTQWFMWYTFIVTPASNCSIKRKPRWKQKFMLTDSCKFTEIYILIWSCINAKRAFSILWCSCNTVATFLKNRNILNLKFDIIRTIFEIFSCFRTCKISELMNYILKCVFFYFFIMT